MRYTVCRGRKDAYRFSLCRYHVKMSFKFQQSNNAYLQIRRQARAKSIVQQMPEFPSIHFHMTVAKHIV